MKFAVKLVCPATSRDELLAGRDRHVVISRSDRPPPCPPRPPYPFLDALVQRRDLSEIAVPALMYSVDGKVNTQQ